MGWNYTAASRDEGAAGAWVRLLLWWIGVGGESCGGGCGFLCGRAGGAGRSGLYGRRTWLLLEGGVVAHALPLAFRAVAAGGPAFVALDAREKLVSSLLKVAMNKVSLVS